MKYALIAFGCFFSVAFADGYKPTEQIVSIEKNMETNVRGNRTVKPYRFFTGYFVCTESTYRFKRVDSKYPILSNRSFCN